MPQEITLEASQYVYVLSFALLVFAVYLKTVPIIIIMITLQAFAPVLGPVFCRINFTFSGSRTMEAIIFLLLSAGTAASCGLLVRFLGRSETE